MYRALRTTVAVPLLVCLLAAAATDAAAQTPFSIKDDRFVDRSWPHRLGSGTNLEFFEADGSLRIRGNYDALPDGRRSYFVPGATHTWVGRATLYGYVFESDKDDPLRFAIDEDKGYYYVSGKGTITMPDGTVVKLPRP